VTIQRDDENGAPQHALAEIQAQFAEGLVLASDSARRTSLELDLDPVDLVSAIERPDFHTSVSINGGYQDVYHHAWKFLVLRVAFAKDPHGRFMLALEALPTEPQKATEDVSRSRSHEGR
jgi:hypothetical protein